ncbi:expressed unknown protein [Seminavis robusta]|uniref:Uncharacterized protein n=1 Tax=Seminavis robusta TaxID=568900 RepID=A0A9N8HLT2_9STRA|nr:expressed unknown protein [Seminavis robusta]|eukprot:Sro701_g189751.1  (209) ;mRNA; f:9552-10178
MRINTSQVFSKWLLDKSFYPYNELRATRYSFECRYVLLEAGEVQHPSFRSLKCVAVSSFDPPSLEQLIMSGNAKPMTPDMSCILDSLESWGYFHNIEWYSIVLDMVATMFEEDKPTSKEKMYKQCIYWRVREKAHETYEYESLRHDAVLTYWSDWFDRTYPIVKVSFRVMTLMSEDFVSDIITYVQTRGIVPYPSNMDGPDSITSSED